MSCSRTLIRNFLSVWLLVVSQLSSAQEINLPVQILGHAYEAIITENTHLQRKVSDSTLLDESKHYSGVIKNIDDSWVRFSLINSQWQGVVSLFGTMHIIQPGTVVQEGAASASYVLNSKPVEAGEMLGTCGRGDDEHSIVAHMPEIAADSVEGGMDVPTPLAATFAEFCAQQVNGVCVIAEVEIAFDMPFQAAFGAQATAQALSILNIVDGHYLNDLNISIDAITVEMLANDLFNTSVAASPVLDAGTLLDDIETKKNNNLIPFVSNNNALTHVVTGRDFAGNTLGVAYLGSVCEANGFSTGTSSIYYDGVTPNVALTAVVVAHELAHNLGSDHDGPGANVLCPVNTFIMSPGIGAGLTNFSSCSVTDIEARISLLPSPELCLDYPTDVAITEDAGNNGTLNASQEFTSAYTVSIENGFEPVDQLEISGSINLAEGTFISVTANGILCAIAVDGGSYTCSVANPGVSVALRTQVRVNNAISNVSIIQTTSEQTDHVQDLNVVNNSLTSMFAITNGDIVTNDPNVNTNNNTLPNTINTPNVASNNAVEEEEGGAGSLEISLLGSLLLLYGFSRRIGW